MGLLKLIHRRDDSDGQDKIKSALKEAEKWWKIDDEYLNEKNIKSVLDCICVESELANFLAYFEEKINAVAEKCGDDGEFFDEIFNLVKDRYLILSDKSIKAFYPSAEDEQTNVVMEELIAMRTYRDGERKYPLFLSFLSSELQKLNAQMEEIQEKIKKVLDEKVSFFQFEERGQRDANRKRLGNELEQLQKKFEQKLEKFFKPFGRGINDNMGIDEIIAVEAKARKDKREEVAKDIVKHSGRYNLMDCKSEADNLQKVLNIVEEIAKAFFEKTESELRVKVYAKQWKSKLLKILKKDNFDQNDVLGLSSISKEVEDLMNIEQKDMNAKDKLQEILNKMEREIVDITELIQGAYILQETTFGNYEGGNGWGVIIEKISNDLKKKFNVVKGDFEKIVSRIDSQEAEGKSALIFEILKPGFEENMVCIKEFNKVKSEIIKAIECCRTQKGNPVGALFSKDFIPGSQVITTFQPKGLLWLKYFLV